MAAAKPHPNSVQESRKTEKPIFDTSAPTILLSGEQ